MAKKCYIQTPTIKLVETPVHPIVDVDSPLLYFVKYFPGELYNIIAEMTNLYAIQSQIRFVPTTPDEMNTRRNGKPSLSTNTILLDNKLHVPLISNSMPFNKFSILRQNLHFVNVGRTSSR